MQWLSNRWSNRSQLSVTAANWCLYCSCFARLPCSWVCMCQHSGSLWHFLWWSAHCLYRQCNWRKLCCSDLARQTTEKLKRTWHQSKLSRLMFHLGMNQRSWMFPSPDWRLRSNYERFARRDQSHQLYMDSCRIWYWTKSISSCIYSLRTRSN